MVDPVEIDGYSCNRYAYIGEVTIADVTTLIDYLLSR